jgi:hypothetical protein
MEHYHTLEGGGIAEDKRMINAKTPWTLAHLEERILKAFYNNPAVPPSMRKKLKMALMIKPTLKKKLKGGLSGVSKASGFIRRLMWENSHKHDGAYGNPTWGLAKDSTMKQPIKFDYKKLASASQGGEPTYKNKRGTTERNPYGASPFIQHHFSTTEKKARAEKTAPETEEQKRARYEFMARRLMAKAHGLVRSAPAPARATAPENELVVSEVIPEQLRTHFANTGMLGEPPVGLEVRPKSPEPEAERPTPPTPKLEPMKLGKLPPLSEVLPQIAERMKPAEVKAQEAPKASDESLANEHFTITEENVGKSLERLKKNARDAIPNLKIVLAKIQEVKKRKGYIMPFGTWQMSLAKFPMADSSYGWGNDYFIPWTPNQYDKDKTWYLKFPSDERHMGKPKELLELIDSVKTMASEFKAEIPEAMEAGAYETVKSLAGNQDYPLYPDYLAKTNPHVGASVKHPKGTAGFWDRFWKLEQNLRRLSIYSPLPDKMRRDNKEEFIKRSLDRVTERMEELDAIRKPIAEMRTASDISYRMGALEDWMKFQIDWREKLVEDGESPVGKEVPYTPETIGWVFPPPDREALDATRKRLEEDAIRKAREEEKEANRRPKSDKPRSGHSGDKREANIKAILEKNPKATLPVIGEELKKLGDFGAGGKPLSGATLSPIVKKVKESLTGSGHVPPMCGI